MSLRLKIHLSALKRMTTSKYDCFNIERCRYVHGLNVCEANLPINEKKTYFTNMKLIKYGVNANLVLNGMEQMKHIIWERFPT